MEFLFGKTLSQLCDIVLGVGLPKFTAKQLADWLYKKDVSSFEQMTNLSKKARQMLSENFEVGLTPPMRCVESRDGTKKYLYKYGSSNFIETAYIPDHDRATLCVSCQTGCKMGCKFCLTGKQGFSGNLTTNQILNQIKSLPEFSKLTNLVFMGMGEPMDNIDNVLMALEIITSDYGFAMSPRRVTVSTVGILPALDVFLQQSQTHLALSIHNPFETERRQLMPVQGAQPLLEVLKVIKKYDFSHQRRFSAEYTMINGYNDSIAHAKELVRILNGIPARVNLIRYHANSENGFEPSPMEKIVEFQNILKLKGITATLRASRGEDISAACGLLSTKELQNK